MEETGFPYDQWNRLGLVIGIIQTELDAIRAKYKDPKDCLRECLSLWLQQSYDTDKYGLPSMESLANAALQMGLRAVSSGIQEGILSLIIIIVLLTYNVSVALPSQPKEDVATTVPKPHEISKSLKQLHSTFAILVTRLRSRLEDHIENKKIKLRDVARFFEEYLDIGGLTNAESIDDLFNRIRGYYYFLNCPVIECIATGFLFKEEDNDLQEEMRVYLHDLESFKSTKLNALQSVIPTELPFSNNHTVVKVVLKFDSQWENQNIKRLESFLSRHFNRSDLFNYIQISQGCVCIAFLVPHSHFQYLIDVATPKLKAMCHMGVLQLVINDNVLIDEKDAENDDETLIEAVQVDDKFEVESLGAEKIKGKYAVSL